MASLSLKWFPHIAEGIVPYLDVPSLLSARLADYYLYCLANEALVAGCRRIEIQGDGKEMVFISQGVVLPFFHPSAPLELQYAAMRQARTIIIGLDVVSSERLNSLLAQIRPDARVRIEHNRNSSTGHVLPKLRCLELDVRAGCQCDVGNYVPLQHRARVVKINVLFQGHQPTTTCTCGLVRGVIREGVKHVEIRHWNHNISKEDLFLRHLLSPGMRLLGTDTTQELFRLGVRQVTWVAYHMERGTRSSNTYTVSNAAPAPDSAAEVAALVPPTSYILGMPVWGHYDSYPSAPQLTTRTRSTAILTFAFVFVSYMAARSSRG